jgi:hypothetical protein
MELVVRHPKPLSLISCPKYTQRKNSTRTQKHRHAKDINEARSIAERILIDRSALLPFLVHYLWATIVARHRRTTLIMYAPADPSTFTPALTTFQISNRTDPFPYSRDFTISALALGRTDIRIHLHDISHFLPNGLAFPEVVLVPKNIISQLTDTNEGFRIVFFIVGMQGRLLC